MADTVPTVYVVDDDTGVRESVVEMVGVKGIAAKSFNSAEEFLAAYEPSWQGCVVTDVKMDGMTGLQLQQKLIEKGNPLPIVVITGFADVPMAVRAMQAGAVTFLEKPAKDQELWKAIDQALNQSREQLSIRTQKAAIEQRMSTLTHDEVAVLHKLLEGLPNKRIAADLDIGLRTVELRRSNIMRKMEAGSLPELVRLAIAIDFLKAVETAV